MRQRSFLGTIIKVTYYFFKFAIKHILTLTLDSKEKLLHGLVNNAGIMAVANGISKDGFEYQWQVRRLIYLGSLTTY